MDIPGRKLGCTSFLISPQRVPRNKPLGQLTTGVSTALDLLCQTLPRAHLFASASDASSPTSSPTFGTIVFQKLQPVWSETALLCVHLLGALYTPATGRRCRLGQAAETICASVPSSVKWEDSLTGLCEPETGPCAESPRAGPHMWHRVGVRPAQRPSARSEACALSARSSAGLLPLAWPTAAILKQRHVLASNTGSQDVYR